MRPAYWFIVLCAAGAVLGGCANIVAPTGGPKDIQPPKLLAIAPADSALNIRPSRIELRFDENVTVQDAAAQIQTSPLLPFPLTATANGRRVRISLPDTLLQPATTYRISFGTAIADLHEGNPATSHTYTFSTGAYFDSLSLTGRVYNGATGLPDSGVSVLLYAASASDSAVVRTRPLYRAPVDPGTGGFKLEGLPSAAFRIYALADGNNNLTYDGAGERIAFLDSVVRPDTAPTPILLRTFAETADTASNTGRRSFGGRLGAGGGAPEPEAGKAFTYAVAADTPGGRGQAGVDLRAPLAITFNRAARNLRPDRIFLSYDSAGVLVETPVQPSIDTVNAQRLTLAVRWVPDAAYTLRLLKGFVQDTAGADAPPARYRFRTRREAEYARMDVRIPTRFYGRGYVLQVVGDAGDTLHNAPVTDSLVRLVRVSPGAYNLRIIADSNRNGRWDPGDLFLRRQPEWVYPHESPVPVKGGWEAVVDFAPALDDRTRSRDRSSRDRLVPQR